MATTLPNKKEKEFEVSRKKKILLNGSGAFVGAATGFGVAKVTKSVGMGVITAVKTGVGVKAAPAFAVLGAMVFLSVSAVAMACSGKKKKYSWQ